MAMEVNIKCVIQERNEENRTVIQEPESRFVRMQLQVSTAMEVSINQMRDSRTETKRTERRFKNQSTVQNAIDGFHGDGKKSGKGTCVALMEPSKCSSLAATSAAAEQSALDANTSIPAR